MDESLKGNAIAVIPARSGSKGIQHKNIKELAGMPLIAHSILAAQRSGMFSKIFVSTDSRKYADIAAEYGADASFLRSDINSSDSASSWDAVREVLNIFRKRKEYFETVMLLQPTSPIRTEVDIKDSFRLFVEKKAKSVISVTETEHSPLWCNTLPESLSMDNFRNEKYSNQPRQLLPKYYQINGAIYLLSADELYKDRMFKEGCYAYIMPRERSIDIDSELDFMIAEQMILRQGEKTHE